MFYDFQRSPSGGLTVGTRPCFFKWSMHCGIALTIYCFFSFLFITGCGTAFDFHKTQEYMFLVGEFRFELNACITLP